MTEFNWMVHGKCKYSGERMYWSNEQGWTSRKEDRTLFSKAERDRFALPELSDEIVAIEWYQVSTL